MNQEHIGVMLEDLVKEDPGLQEQEEALRRVIAALVELRPKATINTAFKKDLKRRLLEESDPHASKTYLTHLMSRMKKVYNPVWAVIALVIVVGGAATYVQVEKRYRTDKNRSGQISINQVGSHAFGTIALGQGAAETGNRQDLSKPLAATGTIQSTSDSMATTAVGIKAPDAQGGIVYKYKGTSLASPEEKVEVLKRVVGQGPGGVSGILNASTLNLTGRSVFDQAEFQSISFTLKGESYRVDADFANGRLSISNDWSKIASAVSSAALSAQDVPDDAALVRIADQFVSKFGISTAAYGHPVVMNWKAQSRGDVSEPNYFVPNEVTVTYPLSINGRKVYGPGGNMVGMNVSIDVRTKKATGISDILTHVYEGSAYEAETNVSRLLEVAQAGGIYGSGYPGAAAEEVELSAPERAYMLTTQYNNGTQTDLLVPAYVFPVAKKGNAITPEVIVVPLARELLQGSGSSAGSGSSGVIEPMPAILQLDDRTK